MMNIDFLFILKKIFRRNETPAENIFFSKLDRIVDLEMAQFSIRNLFGTNSIFEDNKLRQKSRKTVLHWIWLVLCILEKAYFEFLKLCCFVYPGRFHIKDDKTLQSWKIPLSNSIKTPNTIVCWLKIVDFFLS
jgi:hypothetical protein